MCRVYGVLRGVLESDCMGGKFGKHAESEGREPMRGRAIDALQAQTVASARSAAKTGDKLI
jgi:hypothetical protein